MFQNRLASLTSVVNDSRSDLDAALSDLSVALGEVQRFVAGSRNQAIRADQQPGRASPRSWSTTASAVENVLHIAPNAIANYQNIYYPHSGGVSGAFSLSNFANPVYFFCGLIGAIENTTAPETAKLCAQYLGPALRLLNFNNLPFPINLYLRPAPKPENIIYTDPKLAPGGAGPGDAPEPLPSVSAYTGAGDIPPPPGWGAPPGPPGLYSPGRTRYLPFRRRRCSPAHRFRGPPPSSRDLAVATWTACCFRRRRRPPLRRCRPIAPCCLRKGRRHHDSRRAREEQACGSRVKTWSSWDRACALTATGCAFQGLNSLPLPGAVGRGPDAVNYHVEVPNVATLESNSPVMINDVVVGSVGKMTGRRTGTPTSRSRSSPTWWCPPMR